MSRVAVIIPVYNLRPFLGEAIESVLAQTLPTAEVEVVVVDDGSTDGSAEVARGYGARVRCLRQANRGLSAARNAGIRASRAPLLTFLDADDRIAPDKLASQIAVLDARPEVGLVYTGVRYVDEMGHLLPQSGWYRREGDVFADLVLGNRIHAHVALVRREAVQRVGGFDEALTSLEDWDLWLRLARHGIRWALVDRPLADYRMRAGAMHRNPGRMAENAIRVLDKLFGDPEIPPAIAALRPLAYANAALVASCAHYRSGDGNGGARWMRAAAVAHRGFLTDAEALRRCCYWLLPVGYQRGAMVVAELPRVAALLGGALGTLFAATDLPPEVRRLRLRARVTYWRALLPFLVRRAKAIVRGRRSPLRHPGELARAP